ncbi:MAG: tetratricopeptide repeat protein [Armatimonadetes bacterium]|nr:tetratricopeptide repeat protein [Armatimonadota bacterium]
MTTVPLAARERAAMAASICLLYGAAWHHREVARWRNPFSRKVDAVSLSGLPPTVDYEAVVREAMTRVKENPGDLEARLDLADGYLRLERYRDAAREYGEASSLDESCTAAWAGMAKSLCYLGNFEGAKPYLERASGLDASAPSVLVGRGLLAYKDGDLKAARRDFEAASLADPGDVDAVFHLGQVLWEMHRYWECAEAFLRSLALDSANLVALRTLGNCYVALKEPKLALEAYQRAAEVDPTIETTHYGVGTLLVQLGRGAEAIEAFERALAIDPDYREAWEAIADVRQSSA